MAVTATNAKEATKIRSIVCAIPVRDFEDEKAPGDDLSGGLLDRRDWVHPPIQRCSSRYLATQLCAASGSDASLLITASEARTAGGAR
jgi:hypothetical protein